MKIYIYAIVTVLLLVTSCKDHNDNLVEERGTYVVPVLSEPSPGYFTDNLEKSYVQFDLSLPEGEKIDKAEIEVTHGDKSAILKEVSIPSTGVKVTATEVLNALKMPVSDYKLGETFNLYILTTKGGVVTRSVATFPIAVVCYFDPVMLLGSFDFKSDDWGVAGSVTMVADANDPYKIYIEGYPQAEGLTGNGNRITLNVNPSNFSITGPKVVLADNLAEWDLTYTNYAYEPVSGKYSACDDAYTVTFAISVAQGSFGNNVFTFKRGAK